MTGLKVVGRMGKTVCVCGEAKRAPYVGISIDGVRREPKAQSLEQVYGYGVVQEWIEQREVVYDFSWAVRGVSTDGTERSGIHSRYTGKAVRESAFKSYRDSFNGSLQNLVGFFEGVRG